MEAYKLTNPASSKSESSAPKKRKPVTDAAVKSKKKRKVAHSDDDVKEEEERIEEDEEDGSSKLAGSENDDDESVKDTNIDSSQLEDDGSGTKTSKRDSKVTTPLRPETNRVKTLRVKAAESVRANIFESKKVPCASSSEKKKDTKTSAQVYPMRPNTVPEEELVHANIVPPITAPLPADYIPTVGEKVVVVRQAYADFLDTVPPRITKTLDKARAQDKEDICDLPTSYVTGDVVVSEKFVTNLKVGLIDYYYTVYEYDGSL